MTKIIAIIPARGGSKGIPKKNIIDINGKPMIAWNIEAAKASKFIDEVYISTDNKEIADVSRKFGAKVIDRPDDIAGDIATSESALIHSLNILEKDGIKPELMVFMQCTSPLTSSEDIDNAVQKLIDEKADSCFTATDFHYFVWKQNENNNADGINHDKRFRPRRQDREAQYVESGAIYVVKVDGFKEAGHRFFGKTVLSKMPAERCFEIDEPSDIPITEAMMKNLGQINSNPISFSNLKAILFDFDGVFTDNMVYVDQHGNESVRCERSVGWSLGQLKQKGIKLAVLSTEVNPVVSKRCEKLKIECHQSLGDDKILAFNNWCKTNSIKVEDTLFIGNDINDVDCLKAAGIAVVPSDAYQQAKDVADIVLKYGGGNGAVRELCDIILKKFE